MVEPASIALGTVVAALVAKATDKSAEEAVEAGAGILGRLVGRLRRRFAGDEEAVTALAQVEEVPDSPKLQTRLAELVDQRAANDVELAAELQALVEEARASGVDVGDITQTAVGDGNVQSAAVNDSTITVTYGTPPSVSGLRRDR